MQNLKVEAIIVDYGSTDSSWNLLKQTTAKDKRYKVIRLTRNFGQTPVMTAGFKNAQGSVIVTMDADLQNEPEDILRWTKSPYGCIKTRGS